MGSTSEYTDAAVAREAQARTGGDGNLQRALAVADTIARRAEARLRPYPHFYARSACNPQNSLAQLCPQNE